MIIFVSEELKDLKIGLDIRGYTIAKEDDKIPCDAIICDLKNIGLLNISKLDSSIRQDGTLIIDGSSKTIEEIEYILNYKIYSKII